MNYRITNKNIHNLLYSKISELVTDDYILLDLPYYANVGDVLIWEATLQIMKKTHHRCLYSCSIETYRKPHINNNIILLFLGGGNFGDLWEEHQKFRHQVMMDFPNNPIVQLPQSVWFEDETNMNLDIQFFQNHKAPITICLRDQQSYNIINNNYSNITPLLLPDMALALNIDRVLKRNKLTIKKGNGSLYFLRDDKELVKNNIELPFDAEGDWPCRKYTIKWVRRYENIMKSLEILHVPSRIQQVITRYFYRYIIKDAFLRNGIRFLMSYRIIYATRLHAAILGVLLGKKVYIIDNTYHKCSGVYNLWMKNIDNVALFEK